MEERDRSAPVRERGWSREWYEQRLFDLACRELLGKPPPPAAPPAG